MNPQQQQQQQVEFPYEDIGKAFVKAYYKQFDDVASRPGLACLYSPDAKLTFEGVQVSQREAIVAKLTTVINEPISRAITTVDCQPTPGFGILVKVLGQLKTISEHDHVMGFSHTFLLKHAEGSFFIDNEIFRLALHNISA